MAHPSQRSHRIPLSSTRRSGSASRSAFESSSHARISSLDDWSGLDGRSPLNEHRKLFLCMRCGKHAPVVGAVSLGTALKFWMAASGFSQTVLAGRPSADTKRQYRNRFRFFEKSRELRRPRETLTRSAVYFGLAELLDRMALLVTHALAMRRSDWVIALATMGKSLVDRAERWSIARFDGIAILRMPRPSRSGEGEADEERDWSKRVDLREFRERYGDFMDRMWRRMRRSKYALAFAISMMTGLRPAELKKGVTVRMHGNRLFFEIRGAKTAGGVNGQPWRKIAVRIKSPESKLLAKQLRLAGGQLVVAIKSAAAFKDAVRYHSQQEWPDETYVVTPYSLRHAVRDDLEGKLTREAIAKFMGHASDFSQWSYGAGFCSSSDWRNPVEEVEAAVPVRHYQTVEVRLANKREKEVVHGK